MQTSKYCYLHVPRVSKPLDNMQQDQGSSEETTAEEGIVKVRSRQEMVHIIRYSGNVP